MVRFFFGSAPMFSTALVLSSAVTANAWGSNHGSSPSSSSSSNNNNNAPSPSSSSSHSGGGGNGSAGGGGNSNSKRHVFIFRHCLRSTSQSVSLFANDDSDGDFSTAIQDYLNVSLPNWGTPEQWCTATGFDIMKRTGGYLYDTFLQHESSVHLSFVTDTVSRDVDTAFALAEGIEQAAAENQKGGPTLTGLQNLQYDPVLFKPDKRRPSTGAAGATLCTPPSIDTVANTVNQRLEDLSQPGDLDEWYQYMETYGGTGAMGSWSALPALAVNEENGNLVGGINLLKLVAQMIFYSKASGITDFFPEVTVGELYTLVAWINYANAVVNVGNSLAGVRGAVLMDRVMQLLETDIGRGSSAQVTVIVGHDGDLDNLATALGMSWVLPDPYLSGSEGEWLPTPPGSALHFEYDDDSVTIANLAPVFFQKPSSASGMNEPPQTVNTNGALVPSGVRFTPTFSHTKEVGSTHNQVNGSGGKSAIQILRDRTEHTLSFYDGAMDCYETAQDYNRAAIGNGSSSGSGGSGSGSGGNHAPVPAPTPHHSSPSSDNNNNNAPVPSPHFHSKDNDGNTLIPTIESSWMDSNETMAPTVEGHSNFHNKNGNQAPHFGGNGGHMNNNGDNSNAPPSAHGGPPKTHIPGHKGHNENSSGGAGIMFAALAVAFASCVVAFRKPLGRLLLGQSARYSEMGEVPDHRRHDLNLEMI